MVFAYIGRQSHHEGQGSGLAQTLGTAAPFALGWLVSAPLLGALSRPALTDYRAGLRSVLRAWPAALLIALVIRSVLEGHWPPLSFVAVAFVFNLLTLATWRVVVAATA